MGLWLVLALVSLGQCSDSDDQTSSETNYGVRLSDSPFSSFTSSFATKTESKLEESNAYSPGINAIMNSDGFLNQMERTGSTESKYSPLGPVEAAVHSKKTVEVIPVRFEEQPDGQPQVIEISPYEVPLSIVFRTQTNKINVNQEHKSGKSTPGMVLIGMCVMNVSVA